MSFQDTYIENKSKNKQTKKEMFIVIIIYGTALCTSANMSFMCVNWKNIAKYQIYFVVGTAFFCISDSFLITNAMNVISLPVQISCLLYFFCKKNTFVFVFCFVPLQNTLQNNQKKTL